MKEQYVVYRTFSIPFVAGGPSVTQREYVRSGGKSWTYEIENASTFNTEIDALKWIAFHRQSLSLKGLIFGVEKIYK